MQWEGAWYSTCGVVFNLDKATLFPLAVFVAGAALGDSALAAFVAGAAFGDSALAFSWQVQHLVILSLQFSWWI